MIKKSWCLAGFFLFSIHFVKAQCGADFYIANNPICVGDTERFANNSGGGSGPFSYNWNFGSGATPATSNAQTPPPVVYSTAGIKTITLIYTAPGGGGGCGGGGFSSTIAYQVTVNLLPAASFISNAPQCANAPVNFTNKGTVGIGITYSWDFGADATPAVSTAENPSDIIYSTGGTKKVTLTISNGFCTKVDTQSIVINPTPIASFTSNSPICTGDSVNFQNTGTASGATYAWTFGSGSAPATSVVQSPMGILYGTSGIKTVSLIATTGTCHDTSTQTILINQTPSVSFTSTSPQCQGNVVNFTNTGSSGGNWIYSWAFGAGAKPATSTSQNPNGIIYSTSGTKTVTLTTSDGTCLNTKTQTININPLPVANAGKDTVICNNTSVTIGSAAIAGNTYSWFPTNTLNVPVFSNPLASPTAPTTIYIVTVTNTATGCINTDSIVVTMLAPLAVNAGVDVKICRYDSTQIGAALVTGEKYVWTPSTGLNDIHLPNPVCSPSTTTTYTVSVTNILGCGPVTDEVTVTVHPLPIAEAGPNDSITLGSSTQLTATGGIEYLWSPPTGLSNIGIFNPIANPTVTALYIVKVTDVYGCVNTDSMTVYVIAPNFWVPTAFTPNGDGQNDVFFVHGEGISNFELGVYNRWGEIVFTTKDLLTGWNGKRQLGGEDLPEGAYVYYVKGKLSNGTVINNTGIVNLIR
jgi:gliding motility-associated-like protein